MPVNNMFSTWFNSWFGTGFGVGTGWWNNNWFQNPAQTKTTKQEKFPWLNQQQIANIEKYTANLTWAEKKQEQQKIYQAMIQAIEAENFNDSRTAMENERYRNSLSKTDPRECKFDQSACRQSALVDLVKDARNLKANTDENTVMQMFMQEMDYRGIGMDKLNAYLDSGDESILYETWLKTQRETVQWKSIQQWWVRSLINPAREWWILPESKSEWLNPIWAAAETVDNAANKFADKFAVTWEKAANNLANKIQNMSKKEVAQYRKQYEKLLKDKDWRVGRVQGDTIVEQLWNGIKWNISYDYSDEDFMEWLVSQKANLWESLIWADDILKWETNPNVIQFFGNIPSSAVKTFTATVRGMTNPYDTMKWLYKLAATEEWHQALLQRYGSWDALAKAMNTDPVWVADDVLAVAELGTNIAKWWLKFTWKVTWNQSLANMANNIPTIWSANDALAQKVIWWGTITYWKASSPKTIEIWWVYWTLDKLADASNSNIIKWAVRYAEDVSSISKTIENAKSDFNSIRWKANDWADNIIQNNNRMTKKQQENFKKMSWEDQWKWMNDRNIRTQEDLVDYFIESKNKVDDAMWKIEWQFTSKELTAVLDDSVDFAKKTENKDLGRLQELQTKNANGWLTMQEINEVKRFYEKNNKFNYLKEWTAEKSALATNRDTALREWQQKIATENGLDNLKELNKETQAAKFLADNATNWQSWIKGNNPISLTDWIVFAWDGINSNSLVWLVSKKIFTAPRFQDKLVDVLNYIGWHETKWEINPNYQAIDMKNYEKRILAEELSKVKSEKEFQAWLDKAQEMAWPALPEKIDQWWVVAWDRPFITQNWPTADELGIGRIEEISNWTSKIQDKISAYEREINKIVEPYRMADNSVNLSEFMKDKKAYSKYTKIMDEVRKLQGYMSEDGMYTQKRYDAIKDRNEKVYWKQVNTWAEDTK